jgi:hypothetical protein
MLWFRIGIAAALLCAFGSASFAQSAGMPAHTPHKVHAKKVPKTNDSVEDWDIATPGAARPNDISKDPNVSAGRKKFFDQSTTMDNGGPAGSASGQSSGFMPSMGLSF